MTLNAVRERLEAAFAAREAELERARARRARRALDVTLPGTPLRRGPPASADPDPTRGRGHLPRARLRDRRQPRGRDGLAQLRRAQPAIDASLAVAPRHVLRRRRDAPAHAHLHGPDPRDGGAPAPDLHRDARARLPARHAEPALDAELPPGRGARRRPRHHARRSEGHAACTSSARCSARIATSGCERASSRSPSRRSSSTSRASSAAARAARSASTPAGSRWAAPAWSTRPCSRTSGYDPEEWSGFAWGLGLDRIAAQRHGIPDIRMFWENDLRVLRQF